MQRPSTRAKILIAGVAAVVITGGVLLLGPSFVGATDPENELQCTSDMRVKTLVTHDENVAETRNPRELASSWREAATGTRHAALADQKVFNASDTVTKIGYADSKGRMVAVLVYEKRARGWRLESIIECG